MVWVVVWVCVWVLIVVGLESDVVEVVKLIEMLVMLSFLRLDGVVVIVLVNEDVEL